MSSKNSRRESALAIRIKNLAHWESIKNNENPNSKCDAKLMKIGITERGDAALDISWLSWVKDNNPTILITKNPESLLKTIIDNDLASKNIIVHTTITGFGSTVLEPNVAKYEVSIDAYLKLIDILGRHRIVL